jgi:hypothetical protein
MPNVRIVPRGLVLARNLSVYHAARTDVGKRFAQSGAKDCKGIELRTCKDGNDGFVDSRHFLDLEHVAREKGRDEQQDCDEDGECCV